MESRNNQQSFGEINPISNRNNESKKRSYKEFKESL